MSPSFYRCLSVWCAILGKPMLAAVVKEGHQKHIFWKKVIFVILNYQEVIFAI